MERRLLGTTDLHVTPIGLGLAALGRPGYINLGHAEDLGEEYDVEAMEKHAHAVLDAAWNAGIRYFDAARSYGRAEVFLRSWLDSREITRTDITVGSKWGYTYTAGWQVDAEVHEVKEHSLPVLRRQWGESQANLDGYLNLYQIHSATLKTGVLENDAVLEELARLKREAHIAIGLSLSGTEQAQTLERAIDAAVDGERLFDSVQATWNLLERSVEPALVAARNAGMGIIIKEALANGRLTPKNDSPEFAGKRALLEQQAHRLNTTVDALALAGVLARPWVDVVLSGAAAVGHLQSNVAAVDVDWDDQAEDVLAGVIESPEEYWATRSDLAWN